MNQNKDVFFFIVFTCLLFCQVCSAQFSIAIDGGILASSQIDLVPSSNIDSKGSSISSQRSLGSIGRAQIIKNINDKFNLKLGFGFGRVKKRINYSYTNEFINLIEAVPIGMVSNTFDLNFTEINIGLSLPIKIVDNHKLNFDLGSNVILRKTEMVEAGGLILFSTFSEEQTLFPDHKSILDVNPENKITIGISGALNYSFTFSKFPLSIYSGIIVNQNLSNSIFGSANLIGSEETLSSSIKGDFSYIGWNLGVAYSITSAKK